MKGKEDSTRKKLKRDIADLDASITDMRLDLEKEKDKNSRNARSLKAAIEHERARWLKLKQTLKDLGG